MTAPTLTLQNAADVLDIVATGGTLDLNAAGRERAAKLATLVRQHAVS